MLYSVRTLSNPFVLISAFIVALVFIFGARSRGPYEPHGATNTFDYAANQQTSHSSGSHNLKHVEGLPPNEAADSLIPVTHPIDELIKAADTSLQRLLRSDVANDDVSEAAKLYRGKRKRHPPPGFDKWFEFARKNRAYTIESLFDQIYHDLEPFWGLDPAEMRQQVIDWPFAFSIRNGHVRQRASRLVAGEWLDLWESMFKDIVEFLPDVDIAINNLDEPRIVVDWEDMAKYMEQATKSRNRKKPSSEADMITDYPTREELSFNVDDMGTTGQAKDGPWLSETKFWDIARKACPSGSKARKAQLDSDLTTNPEFPEDFPPGSSSGYVSNFTSSRSVCEHPHLRNLHGAFVKPRFTSVNTTLFPLFAGCKIADVSNEILLPAAKYFSSEADFSFEGAEQSWSEKKDGMIWRGQATGGAHNKDNWKHFHRQRFVAMTNGSEVAREEFRRDNQPQQPKQAPPTNLNEHGDPQHLEVKGAFAGVEIVAPLERSDDEPKDTVGNHVRNNDRRREGVTARAAPFPAPPRNIPLPKTGRNPYGLSTLSTNPSTLSAWLKPKTDIGFHHLMCDSWVWSILGPGLTCDYLDPYYKALPRVEMSYMFSHKYLPDIDGNSYSGRYLSFLRSGSLPLKATIYAEWFDSRLVAWKHFVPLDNTFADLWGVNEYFWGYGDAVVSPSSGSAGHTSADIGGGDHDPDADEAQFRPGGFREGESRDPELRKPSHDAQARRIAEEGQQWAQRVLRREDMLVYVYRLVLEYARIVSEDREKMGYVKDLF